MPTFLILNMSEFKTISDTLFRLAYDNKHNGMITLFLIGCYPHEGGNLHHEYPLILRNIIKKFPRLNISVYLIDPCYKSGHIPNYICDAHFEDGLYKKHNLSVMIYPYKLLNKTFSREWDRLYELCYIVAKFNCCSIIFNFAGINETRFDYHDQIHIHNRLNQIQ